MNPFIFSADQQHWVGSSQIYLGTRILADLQFFIQWDKVLDVTNNESNGKEKVVISPPVEWQTNVPKKSSLGL